MPRPFVIAVDARYLAAGFSGIGDYSRNLLEALSRIDSTNTYHILVHDSFDCPLALPPNFHLHPVAARPISFSSVFTLHRLIQSFKPDIFHAHSPVAPIFLNSTIPTIFTVHDLQPLMMPEWTGARPWPVPALHRGFYHWLYPRVFASASQLITVSHSTRDSLIARFSSLAEKTTALPSGFTPALSPPDSSAIFDRLAREHKLPARYLLYYGSSRPNKNLPTMLAAFARLLKLDPSFSDLVFVLVLSADRFRPEVDAAIARENLSAFVRILPQVSEPEKRVLLDRAAALFFATRLEGFGIPILEAQAAGTPVVAASADASPETAGSGAILVSPDDPSAQADALFKALTDKGLQSTLVAAGKENIKRSDWNQNARGVLEIYAKAASPRP